MEPSKTSSVGLGVKLGDGEGAAFSAAIVGSAVFAFSVGSTAAVPASSAQPPKNTKQKNTAKNCITFFILFPPILKEDIHYSSIPKHLQKMVNKKSFLNIFYLYLLGL